MSNHSLSAQNLMAALPQALQNDPKLSALASSIASILADRGMEIRKIGIYNRIDELPEDLLDILAYDFKVDWWDENYTIEQKRELFKDSFFVHRRLGTVGSVKKALSAIYPNVEIQEWFEYGGEPYTFRLIIDATEFPINSELHKRALFLIGCYKNLRSTYEEIVYNIFPDPAEVHTGAVASGSYMTETVSADYSNS